jgi:predicted O-methyltransferase YrrM
MLDFRRSTILSTTKNFLSDNTAVKMFDDVPKPPGEEHYVFLASLSMQISNKTIIELGTHPGNSAYVLAYGNRIRNANNKIITFDIIEKPIILRDTKNIDYRIADLFDPVVREINRNLLLSSDFIFIDISPHEGIMEYDMYEWLRVNDYKGIVLFDDIHLGPGHMGVTSGHSMQEFWKKVDPKYKIDLTSVGHWSGTGLVCFHFENYVIIDKEL